MSVTLFISVYLFVLGTVLGSFYGVVGMRLPVGDSIVHPPSHCTHCGKRLNALELIPLVGYLVGKGKCSACNTHISPMYPMIELLTGLLFVWAYHVYGFTWDCLILMILISLGVIISISDLLYLKIPNSVIVFFLFPIVMIRFFHHPLPWWSYIAGAVAGAAILLAAAIFSRGGMGMGDVKLLFLLGGMTGFQDMLLILFLSSLIGTLAGGGLILAGLRQRKQPLPFGPLLCLGALLAVAYGEDLIHWYTSWLL